MTFDSQVIDQDETRSIEEEIQSNGMLRTFWTTRSPLKDANGNSIGIVGVSRDISNFKQNEHRKNAERLILETIATGQPLQVILDTLTQQIEELWPDTRCSILLLDETGTRLHHGSAPSLPQEYINAINGLQIGPAAGSCGTAAYTGKTIIVENIAQHPLWEKYAELALAHGLIACWSVPILNSAQQALGTLALYPTQPRTPNKNELDTLSISAHLAAIGIERRRTEDQLLESEQRLKMTLEATCSGTWDWNIEAGQVLFGDQWLSSLGYKNQLIQQPVNFWEDIVHPEDFPKVQEALQRHFNKETESYECVNRLRKANGQWRWNWNCGQVVEWTDDGKPLRMVGTDTDITELKKTEEALKQSQQAYEDLVNSIEGIVWESDFPSYQVTFVSNPAERILGYPIQDWLTNPKFLNNLIHPDDREWVFASCLEKTFAKQNHVLEFRLVSSDGRTVWVRDLVTVIVGKDQPVKVRGVMIDITERKNTEEALDESRKRFQAIFESAGIGITLVDASGRIVESNQSFQQFVGYSTNELSTLTFLKYTHQDDAQTNLSYFQELKRQTRDSYTMENRYIKKDGQEVWGNLTVTPIRNNDGKLEYAIAMIEDITERKSLEEALRRHTEELEEKVQQRAERIQELEQRRMQVEKLAALAQIAAGVAHEINNPLASISQSLVLLKRAIPEEHPHFRYMAKAEDCIDRIAQITKHLYQLYRPSSPTPTPIDLRMCILTATEIMEERALKYGIEIRMSPISEQITTLSPRGELIQVLCNLIHNAIDASPRHSTIEVGIVKDPETLSIFVADEGEGIPPDAAPHIFEPFYTTKQNRAEGGMGLGLSISHSLVESMGGVLDFSTTMGHGSTFRVTLPLTSS